MMCNCSGQVNEHEKSNKVGGGRQRENNLKSPNIKRSLLRRNSILNRFLLSKWEYKLFWFQFLCKQRIFLSLSLYLNLFVWQADPSTCLLSYWYVYSNDVAQTYSWGGLLKLFKINTTHPETAFFKPFFCAVKIMEKTNRNTAWNHLRDISPLFD